MNLSCISPISSAGEATDLYPTIASDNFLGFKFNDRSYDDQITQAIQESGNFCAVTVQIVQLKTVKAVWIEHNFAFMGGSLGCAEGEKIAIGFELAYKRQIPVVVVSCSGGARMQEGTLSLMQMAKVSVTVSAFKKLRIPFISVLKDPCYGGVAASYAMQGDIRIAIKSARVGFAGPNVILNTVYSMDQARYDAECPQNFQSAEYLMKNGQIDIIVDDESQLSEVCSNIFHILYRVRIDRESSAFNGDSTQPSLSPELPTIQDKLSSPDQHYDHTISRRLDRFTAHHVITSVFDSYIELEGDGCIGSDVSLKGGIAIIDSQRPCVVIANYKGADCNFGMATPHGYRKALRLMQLAQHFELPIFTIVDTVGAYPSFESERYGQSEALASNLLFMASLTVPLISLVLGEGGSGGALALAMGNVVGMMEHSYYALISPEGAASILGRYKDEDHKMAQFVTDARDLSLSQHIFSHQLKKLKVIDYIVDEDDYETCDTSGSESKRFSKTLENIKKYFLTNLTHFSQLSPEELIFQRYNKFRAMGQFRILTNEEVSALKLTPRSTQPRRPKAVSYGPQSKTLQFIADLTLNSTFSDYLKKKPNSIVTPVHLGRDFWANDADYINHHNTKWILDHHGPDAVVNWIKSQKKVFVTDTTMRDAHQSLLATRVRTIDLFNIAFETSHALKDAFSLEVWGGATFDVCYRFLKEDPWERLSLLRKAIPNIMFQMLIRGANAIGYTSYPNNVIERFVELAVKNGIDVFRVFDCFNDLAQMEVCINAVRKSGKIAEVCVCFTGDFLSPDEHIYTLDYYRDLTERIVKAGAHIICIKDMAGLLKPQMAKPMMEMLRSVTDLPIHFHTHNTSSTSLTTCINMASYGCNILDFAMASMADTTSQPSLNSFLASMHGHPRDPQIPHLTLERLDLYWSQCRTLYQQFESGLKSGTARVYEHQIPGGQYSNLYAQCSSLGIMHKWNDVLDMYRDVNQMFGNIIKVTPSSKCVGDMTLYLMKNNLTCQNVLERGEDITFPESVVKLFMGELGFPHHGFPENISKVILKGAKPLTSIPGNTLEAANFEAERKALKAIFSQEISDEQVISSILYPKVFNDFMIQRARCGWKINWLDTETFSFGMNINQAITISYPEDNASIDLVNPHTIKLKRIGPLTGDSHRVFEFLVDGQRRKVCVQDQIIVNSQLKVSKADKNNISHVPSPLPGIIEVIFVGKGAEVKKKDPIMTISAMKMEVLVLSPHDGQVVELPLKLGDNVDTGSLVAIVQPNHVSYK